MGQKTTQEIIEATREYFCFGLEDSDNAARIEAARKLEPGSKVVDFGTGQARHAIMMAMANPGIKVFTFDRGRYDMIDEELLERTLNRIVEQEVSGQVFFVLSDSRTAMPNWSDEIGILNIDSDGSYEVSKAEIERWFPFVKSGGTIFIQSYGYGGIKEPTEKYPGLRQAVDEYLSAHSEYELLEEKHGNTRIIKKK